MGKSTNKELVAEMEAINVDGKLDKFIAKAKAYYYHDFKQPEHVVCGKTDFVNESAGIPELADLRNRVMNGEFDENADEDDKADMRKDLPASMWERFGLNPLN
jgi:hypothetical protein